MLAAADAVTRYVRRTGVDALAVAISNVHGGTAAALGLELDRSAEIRRTVEVPFVLLGASGLLGGLAPHRLLFAWAHPEGGRPQVRPSWLSASGLITKVTVVGQGALRGAADGRSRTG
jgi:hypothetical protein